MEDMTEKIGSLRHKLLQLQDRLDREKKTALIAELEEKTHADGFWNDSQKAAQVMKELEGLREELGAFDKLMHALQDIEDLAPIAESETEKQELSASYEDIARTVDQMEFQALLGGPYDRNAAIITIHSGAGGVDAQDFAEMIMRMYLRWAEREGFSTRILDESRGAEAGIKSVTIEIDGAYAYGYLRSEHGVHRLVRLSPFNSDNLRQTSFASVEVLPIIEEMPEVVVDAQDLRIDTYRASGAGGQHVNKTESAIRITHIPSGIVVTCQSERSQLQNREQAMKIVLAKLHKTYVEEQEQKLKAIKGESASVEWGSQIRSYVLHPYTLAKDHRTKHEATDVYKVLDGDLRPFMESYLQYNRVR
ncbi:MAG: peptide chain release factor 2 [Candidatus Moranbacteria bacterium]|nr:peptide chain release factor 2 [Candidatus Moranbacteria bacterium]